MFSSRPFCRWQVVRCVGCGSLMVALAGFIAGCPPVGTGGSADPCEGVMCAAGEECVDGACVPEQEDDLCEGVECEEGEDCVEGNCVPVGPAEVSFSTQIQPIFDTKCIRCHAIGGSADEILLLNSEESFDELVGQPSVQEVPDLIRVVPGDSGDSLLFLKVSSDSPPVGNRMPFGLPSLSADEIDLIREWIDQGANDN